MLFTRSGLPPGATILVQGGRRCRDRSGRDRRAAGFRVWATSRDEEKRRRALELGADQVFPSGASCPGGSTRSWSQSARRPGLIRCAPEAGRPGAVVAGRPAAAPPADLNRRSSSCNCQWSGRPWHPDELERLAVFLEQTGVRPKIDRIMPLEQAKDGFAAMIAGDLFGKVVFTA
jgi:NADPH:quinone reductase-like Zn-dependent oxidoreductase